MSPARKTKTAPARARKRKTAAPPARKRKAATPAAAAAAKTATPRHRASAGKVGTAAAYRGGCKCDACRRAASDARKARKTRTARERTLEQLQHELEALQQTTPVAGKSVDVPREVYTEYVSARHARDAAELELARAELALKRAVGDAAHFKVGGRRVGSWDTFTRRFFDTAGFRAKHPGMWDRFQRTGSTRRFVVTLFAATPPARTAAAFVHGRRR